MSFWNGVKTAARDSFAGQTLYYVSGRRLCKPEYELSSYVVPEKYTSSSVRSLKSSSANVPTAPAADGSVFDAKNEDTVDTQAATASSSEVDDDVILVDWDGPDDPLNPQNWPSSKKVMVALIMAICTASLYMGSALFTPAEGQLVKWFHTSEVKITLGLSMFVWGYGIASLWFSPMSELPAFGGRLYIYLFNQFLFACLQIPTALVNHVAPFAVLRLLAGMMAAPPLSTGGATLGDIFGFPSVVYAISVWSMGAIMGPFIGPLIGGALVQHNSWRWAFWYLLIMSGSVLAVMVCLFPETSEQALLMKKAKSLRRRTGNPNILAPGDIKQRTQKTREVLRHIFWQPIKLTLQEPVLMLMDVHLGLMYSILYLFFEAIPIAYSGVYHFNLVQTGMAFLPFLVGCMIAISLYGPYIQFRLVKPILAGTPPDVFAVFGNVAILVSCLVPVGILIFAWTAHPHIHWVVSMVGNMISAGSVWLMFQTYLAFLSNLYPPSQVASAYASNGVSRAILAAGFPLFARPMYNTLAIDGFPVGWGCSLLAFICIPLIGLPIYLRVRGKALHMKAIAKYGEH